MTDNVITFRENKKSLNRIFIVVFILQSWWDCRWWTHYVFFIFWV